MNEPLTLLLAAISAVLLYVYVAALIQNKNLSKIAQNALAAQAQAEERTSEISKNYQALLMRPTQVMIAPETFIHMAHEIIEYLAATEKR